MPEREPGSDDDLGTYPVDDDGALLIPLGDALAMIALGLIPVREYRPSTSTPRSPVATTAWRAAIEKEDREETLAALRAHLQCLTTLRDRARKTLVDLRRTGIDLPEDHEATRDYDDAVRETQEAIRTCSSMTRTRS